MHYSIDRYRGILTCEADRVFAKGALHYLHTDYQGSVVMVTDSAGTIEQHTTYYPYGEPHRAPSGQPILYGGKERLATTDDYNFDARRYHAPTLLMSAPDPCVASFPHLSPFILRLDDSSSTPSSIYTNMGGEDRGSTSFDMENNSALIKLSDNLLGMIAHELKHACQFENGELNFGRGNLLNDIYDEKDAISRGRLFGQVVTYNVNKEYNNLLQEKVSL